MSLSKGQTLAYKKKTCTLEKKFCSTPPPYNKAQKSSDENPKLRKQRNIDENMVKNGM